MENGSRNHIGTFSKIRADRSSNGKIRQWTSDSLGAVSIGLAIEGFRLLRLIGKPAAKPNRATNLAFENTTTLVTAGLIATSIVEEKKISRTSARLTQLTRGAHAYLSRLYSETDKIP